MKYFYPFVIICSLFATIFFSGFLTYPIFSNNSTLTAKQHTIINDKKELEFEILNSTTTTPVISLDWFNAVNSIFNKFVDTEVVDIISKTKFIVQRTGGIYHADIEAINSENLEKIHTIFNHDWQWTKRPVLVKINSMWVAGSMSGMDHGYSLISDNGQIGHFCLHFENSKTHGTKRVDNQHQKNIKYALKHYRAVKHLLD